MAQNYKLKQGVQLHPFSDQSGLGFFDSSTTIVTTVKISQTNFNDFMNGDFEEENSTDEEVSLYQTVISSLLNQGFIEKVSVKQ